MAESLRNWQRIAIKWLPAALLGAAAFWLVLTVTDPPGPGLDPDAMQYMGAAESLVTGHGYRVPTAKWTSPDSTEPLAHFPPGYPTVLALPVQAGMAPPQAARLVQAFSAFLTICVLVLLVSDAATPIAGMVLAAALCVMSAMLEVHVSVLSEPLFLACTALALSAMARAPTRPLRAGLPAALAVATRYAGAALVGAVTLWAFVQPGTLRTRVRRALLALLPAFIVQGAWVLRTRFTAGPGEIRHFAFYGNLGPTIAQGGATLVRWLVPDDSAESLPMPHRNAIAIAAAVALVTLSAIGIWRVRRALRVARKDANDVPHHARGADEATQAQGAAATHDAVATHDAAHVATALHDDPTATHTTYDCESPHARERYASRAPLAWKVITAAALTLACYMGIVLVSRLTADPFIPLDQRIMAPALLLVSTMAAVALAWWWTHTRLVIARIAMLGALLGWWLGAYSATAVDARYAMRWGSDFAGQQWRSSELLAWAREHATHTPLYTNWPALTWFHLHRPSREIPHKSDRRTLAAFADTVRVRGGRVLLFDIRTADLAPNDSVLRTRGLRVIERLADGAVLAPVAHR